MCPDAEIDAKRKGAVSLPTFPFSAVDPHLDDWRLQLQFVMVGDDLYTLILTAFKINRAVSKATEEVCDQRPHCQMLDSSCCYSLCRSWAYLRRNAWTTG